jgi:hypothetical protein
MLQDDSLDKFLGGSGHMLALSLIDTGLPQVDLVEFWKRLYVNGYERARFHLQAAEVAGVIQPNLPPGFFWDGEIDAVLAWAASTGRTP